jgi:hypothetical protein
MRELSTATGSTTVVQVTVVQTTHKKDNSTRCLAEPVVLRHVHLHWLLRARTHITTMSRDLLIDKSAMVLYALSPITTLLEYIFIDQVCYNHQRGLGLTYAWA